MKIMSWSVCSVLVAILVATSLHAQSGRWEQLNGPEGGNSIAMASGSDGTIYLATKTELFMRSPASPGWTKAGVLPFQPNVGFSQPLIQAGGKLFLIDAYDGVRMSSDGGKIWAANTWPGGSAYGLTAMNGILYAAAWDAIYRSRDSGHSWKIVLRDTTFNFANITGGIGGKLYASGNGIYVNVQGDSVWERSNPVVRVNEFDLIFQVDSAVCLAIPKDGYGNYLYRTTNAGQTWDSVSGYGYFAPISKDSSGMLWTVMGGGNPVLRSSDSGATWYDSHFSGRIEDWGVATFCVSPTNELYLSTRKDVYHYSRGQGQWVLWEDSLRIANIYSVLPFSDDSILVSCSNGYYRTSDGGHNWTLDSVDLRGLFSPGTVSNMKLLRDHDGYLYSGPLKYDPHLREWLGTEDTEWYEFNGSLHPDVSAPQALAVDSSGYIYSPGGTQTYGVTALLRSSDHGSTWESLLQSSYTWHQMTVDPKGRIVATVSWSQWPDEGVILRSTDHGETWDSLYKNPWRWWPPDDPEAICVTQSGRIVASDDGYDSISNPFAMIQSTDDGATWQIANRTVFPTSFALDGDSTVYLADGVVVSKSTDAGENWHLTSYSEDTNLNFVAVSPNHHLYAGSLNNGVYRYVNSQEGVKSVFPYNSTELSAYIHVSGQSYVECLLPKLNTSASLTIFDILGRMLIRQAVFPNQQNVRIPIPAFTGGLYGGSFLEVYDDSQTYRTRIKNVVEQ